MIYITPDDVIHYLLFIYLNLKIELFSNDELYKGLIAKAELSVVDMVFI